MEPCAAVRGGSSDPGGLPTYRGDRQYRGRVEILRDFLEAVGVHERKTRIMGIANLNPSSFQKYLDFCLTLDLVQKSPGGYRLTPRANAVLDSIDRLLTKSEEVDNTLLEFRRAFSRSQAVASSTRSTTRYISRLAWDEVCRSAAKSATLDTVSRRTGDSPISELPELWLELPDPEDAPTTASRAPTAAYPPPRRQTRTSE